jgi:hypothetical protein
MSQSATSLNHESYNEETVSSHKNFIDYLNKSLIPNRSDMYFIKKGSINPLLLRDFQKIHMSDADYNAKRVDDLMYQIQVLLDYLYQIDKKLIKRKVDMKRKRHIQDELRRLKYTILSIVGGSWEPDITILQTEKDYCEK